LRSPLQPILDALSVTLYPSCCALCKQSLLHFSSLPICESCWSALTPQQGVLCLHCGEDIGIPQSSLAHVSAEEQLCDPCQQQRPDFTKAVAYGVYENELRGLIHLMKYERMTPIAVRLGRLLAPQVAELPIGMGAGPETEVLVVPVPLYRSKQRKRGFNHAERIAHALTMRLQKLERTHHLVRAQNGSAEPVRRWTMARTVLRRQRPTESQARLSPQGRRRNLRHAFKVRDAEKVRGREVLLVDDIYTTGATAAACSRVLLRAGAKAVWVATVARAQREGVAMWDAASITASEQVGL
jgi:predicted amidophosphoribosyltransferase